MDLHVSKELPSAQCYVAGWMKGSLGGMDTCICVAVGPSLSTQTITVLLILQYSIKGFFKRSACFEGQTNVFMMDLLIPRENGILHIFIHSNIFKQVLNYVFGV